MTVISSYRRCAVIYFCSGTRPSLNIRLLPHCITALISRKEDVTIRINKDFELMKRPNYTNSTESKTLGQDGQCYLGLCGHLILCGNSGGCLSN